MFERRLYFHLDWALIGALLMLCAMGVLMIYSAGQSANSRLYQAQLSALGLGLVAFLVALSIDYRRLADRSHLIYFGLLGLLVYVLLFGVVRGGARRWIPLGVFNLQPSEFAKLAVALVLAKFFGESRRGNPTLPDLLIAGGLTLVPLVLIARQPDLGTAVTILPVFVAIVFVAGLPMRILGAFAVVALLATPIAWKFALQDYQKQRVLTSSIRLKTPEAPGTSRSRPALRLDPGASGGRGSPRGRRDSCGSCPSPTTISSSQSGPKSRALPACSWLWAYTCS
jgi:rod shape determining protein RodA